VILNKQRLDQKAYWGVKKRGVEGLRPPLKWEHLGQIYGIDARDGVALDYQPFQLA
jgi:hypothetical protein